MFNVCNISILFPNSYSIVCLIHNYLCHISNGLYLLKHICLCQKKNKNILIHMNYFKIDHFCCIPAARCPDNLACFLFFLISYIIIFFILLLLKNTNNNNNNSSSNTKKTICMYV